MLDRKVQRPHAIREIPAHSDYSPTVRLAFGVLRWFFLLIAGFSIACLFSASLQATTAVEILVHLLSRSIGPLAILSFCTVAIAVISESLR